MAAFGLWRGWVALAGVRYYLLHDERFVVTSFGDIQISGNEHLTRAQILSVFGADLERNIFQGSLAERRADLERLPWVYHATVMRLLPNQLRIADCGADAGGVCAAGNADWAGGCERRAAGYAGGSGGRSGYSFPVLTGLSASDPASARTARMEMYRSLWRSWMVGAALTESLSEVDVSDPEDVKALIAMGEWTCWCTLGMRIF